MGGQQSKIDQVIAHIQNETGYHFKNKDLIEEALRHGSVRGTAQTFGLKSFERLEFLGDSILHFVISEYLFKKNPKDGPGSLSIMRESYVNNQKLNQIAHKLKLVNFAEMGRSMSYNAQRYANNGDMVESLLGAIYIDALTSNSKEPIKIVSDIVIKVWELPLIPTEGWPYWCIPLLIAIVCMICYNFFPEHSIFKEP